MINIKPAFGILVMLLGCLLPGCMNEQGEPSGTQAIKFSITPNNIKYSQKFSITLPKAHPSKMSIRTPEGEWYWVQDADEKILFMPDAEFKAATKITVYPSRLKGTTWIDGKRVESLVFKSSGEYLIYIADNLETEPENTFYFMDTVTVTK